MADVQRYLNLVAGQHADKSNYMAWLKANLDIVDDIASISENMPMYFDLDTAVGVQLDIIGEIVGVNRTVDFQPTGDVSPVLTDDNYRLAIKARIAKNQWDGTIAQVLANWENLLPLIYLVIKDNQDMSINALVIGLTDTMQQDLVTHGYIIPKPQGVRINYAYPPGKAFAYGIESEAFGGYGEGYWIEFV